MIPSPPNLIRVQISADVNTSDTFNKNGNCYLNHSLKRPIVFVFFLNWLDDAQNAQKEKNTQAELDTVLPMINIKSCTD